MTIADVTKPKVTLEDVHGRMQAIETEVRKRIVGSDAAIRSTLIAMFAKGHILVEGVPGLAKTLIFKTFAEAVHVDFRRISFAADLLPKDVIGIEHLDPVTRKLELVVKGPLHTNILLADELNRARTSSKGSVLEPMEEGQVTTELGGTYKLARFFMVAATQNPVEEEGTFGLGRAEKDRFLMMVPIGYATPAEEEEIIHRYGVLGRMPQVNAVATESDLLEAREAITAQVHVEPAVVTKIQRLVDETRPERSSVSSVRRLVENGGGGSPRAALAIVQAARASALLHGVDYVGPNEIADVVPGILRHRIVFKPGEVEAEEAQATVQAVIEDVMKAVL